MHFLQQEEEKGTLRHCYHVFSLNQIRKLHSIEQLLRQLVLSLYQCAIIRSLLLLQCITNVHHFYINSCIMHVRSLIEYVNNVYLIGQVYAIFFFLSSNTVYCLSLTIQLS